MAPNPKTDPKKNKRHSHKFIIGYHRVNGKLVAQKGPPVPIVWPTEPVILDLMAGDATLAHKKKGEGDTRHCAVACLIRRQAERFLPYKVNFVVEFMDSRVFIGIGKAGEYPTKCLRYEHWCSWLTKMFDKKGYQKLLDKIEEGNGKIYITLRPYRLRLNEYSPGKKQSPRDGSRSKVHQLVRGEQRRSMRLSDRSIQQIEREAKRRAQLDDDAAQGTLL